MPDDATAPECAPPDRETTHRLHWVRHVDGRVCVIDWDDGCWFKDGYYEAPDDMRDDGWRYVAPAHPPQPVDPEVVEAVASAIRVFRMNGMDSCAAGAVRALAILRGEPDPAGEKT